MHEGEMRHVEEVLDDAEARGAHLNGAADDMAAIGLVGLGDLEEAARRLAERRPAIAPALMRRQRRAEAAIREALAHHDVLAFVARDDEITPEQPVRPGRGRDVLQRVDHIPVVERGFLGRSRHASSLVLMSHCPAARHAAMLGGSARASAAGATERA